MLQRAAMPEEVCVCLLAKSPRPGSVKTRLARDIGAAAAAELAQALLRDAWRQLGEHEGVAPRLVLADGSREDLERLGLVPAPSSDQLWEQGDGDLGQRQHRALSRALTEHPAAIVLGSDAPTRPPEHLARAIAELRAGADAVVAPAEDGGYTLLGARRLPPDVFDGVPWSSADTLRAVAARFAAVGLPLLRLPIWYDVDEARDLLRLREDLAMRPELAPSTSAWLESPETRRWLDARSS